MVACGIVGQAVETAVSVVLRCDTHYLEIQNLLLDNDCWLPHVKREVPALSRTAELFSCGNPDTLRNGIDNGYYGMLNIPVTYRFSAETHVSEIGLVADSDLDRKFIEGNPNLLKILMPLFRARSYHGTSFGFSRCMLKTFRIEALSGNGAWEIVFQTENDIMRFIRIPVDLHTKEIRRPKMIQDHLQAMRLAAEFGSRTYTIHIGAYHFCTANEPLEKLRCLARETMERVLPEAERIGLVIAVENSFEPTNSAKEVLNLISIFPANPALGVCFDTGHATCMASAPWKKPESYPDYQRNNWKRIAFHTEDHALDSLRVHVVTWHMHDNDGYRDLDSMPGDGVDWHNTVAAMERCPRMLEFQTEINLEDDVNWAGTSPGPIGGYSVKRLVETLKIYFQKKEMLFLLKFFMFLIAFFMFFSFFTIDFYKIHFIVL